MAEFRIDQVTPGPGTAGRGRHDLVPGEVISLVATAPVGPGVTYAWEILDKVGSTATLSGSTGASVTIGAGGAIVRPCSFRIRLTTNDNGVITSTIRHAKVRTAVLGIQAPLFGESAPAAATLSANTPDLSEDNAVYANRGGLGVSAQNWRDYVEWAWEMVLAVEAAAGTSGPPSGPAGGDLNGTYPNPTVDGLQGRAVLNAAPNDGDVLTWVTADNRWAPLPAAGGGSLQSSYDGGASIVVASSPGTIDISNDTDATDLLTLGHTFAGAGSLIFGDMGAGTTDPAIDLSVQAGIAGIRITDGSATFNARATQLLGPDGSAGAPTYGFGSTAGAGMLLAASAVSIAMGSAVRLSVSTALISGTIPFRAPAGTAADPGFQITAGEGFYSSAADEIGIATGGLARGAFSTTALTLALNFMPSGSRDIGASGNRWLNGFFDTINANTYVGVPASTLQQAYVAGSTINVTAAELTPTIECTTAADATNLLTLTRNHTGTGGGLIAGTMHNAGTGAGISVTMAASPAGGSRAYDAVSSGSNTFDAYRVTGSSVVLNIRPNEISLSTGTTWTLSIGATSKLSFNASGVLVQTNQALQVASNGTAGAPQIYFSAIGSTHGFYALPASSPQPARVGIAGAPGLMAAEFASRTDASSGIPILSKIQFTDVTTSTAGWTALEITRLGSGTGNGTRRMLSIVNSTEIFGITETGAYSVVLAIPDGTSTAAAVQRSAQANTGLFFPTTSQVALTANGTARFTVTSGVITSSLEHYFPDGSAAQPTISNTGDTNTGWYFGAADTISGSTGGTLRFAMSTTDIQSTLPVLPATDNAVALGSATNRWSNLFAVTTTIGDLILQNPEGGPEHQILREGVDGALYLFDVPTKKKYRLLTEECDVTTDDMVRMLSAERRSRSQRTRASDHLSLH